MSAGKPADSPRRIKSVQKASTILETVQYLEEPTFNRLCKELDVSKGTVHTYLETLEDEGLIIKSDGTYQLGFRLVTMGEAVRNQSDLYRAGQAEVEKLAEETGEWVHLTVEHQGREVTIYESSGDNAVATDYHHRIREAPQHLHHTATGKAILACFNDKRVRGIVEQRGLTGRTEETITDIDRLLEELERIRDRGYAVNDEEEVRGIRSIGTAIQAGSGWVNGAISVTAPVSRLSGKYFESEVPELVMEAANIIEVNLETADVEMRQ
ncbi:IclR family transcriptional regulator [Natronococcus occultus]|uniref:Transcriptional regulator n=1 Tax=Natronococcus occultus SP4 TaxID=694430 RepID=L0K673_9EURY|nr:IclR family transcriptional regulator [Natronococcus occultus]AGB40035.1 transcriptional regulator [Natronococcus occultus SP4]